MIIELFYVPGCPNHQAAIDKLKNVLRSAAIDASIEEIAITDDAYGTPAKVSGFSDNPH